MSIVCGRGVRRSLNGTRALCYARMWFVEAKKDNGDDASYWVVGYVTSSPIAPFMETLVIQHYEDYCEAMCAITRLGNRFYFTDNPTPKMRTMIDEAAKLEFDKFSTM